MQRLLRGQPEYANRLHCAGIALRHKGSRTVPQIGRFGATLKLLAVTNLALGNQCATTISGLMAVVASDRFAAISRVEPW